MIKKACLLLSIALPCPVICMMGSCGGGGATLTTGNVDGIWMPDGSHVTADLGGGVTMEQNTGNRARSAASGNAVPQSVSWAVESNDRGVLYMDGQSKTCSILFEQRELAFTLSLVADDRSVSLVFDHGNIPAEDSRTATANWKLFGGEGRLMANGNDALLTRSSDA